MKINKSPKATGRPLKGKLVWILLVSQFVLLSQNVLAQDGELLFNTSCMACHTIGKGRLVGPDLKGITKDKSEEWLISFIKSSTKMINSGDPDAVKIAIEYNHILMPDFMGKDVEIKAIISYLAQAGGEGDKVGDDKQIAATPALVKGDVDTGRMLFQGDMKFKKSGINCSSCHHIATNSQVQGGLLAVELSRSFSKLGGDAGIKAILKSPPFPMMKAAYGNHNLTDKEIAHLTAYLKSTAGQTQTNAVVLFDETFIIGSVILVFLFLFISVVWSGRKRGSVNKSIISRQSR